MTLPRVALELNFANEPLLGRVPIQDESGKPLGDLMMLLPGMRDKPAVLRNRAAQDIYEALAEFADAVVFAEFNIARNQLWVSVRPVKGIRAKIAEAIRARLPEARLVSSM